MLVGPEGLGAKETFGEFGVTCELGRVVCLEVGDMAEVNRTWFSELSDCAVEEAVVIGVV